MQKISVIMASYLGEYPECAKNREEKFVRAVQSFLDQEYLNKELIIVSHNCKLTVSAIYKNFPVTANKSNNIKLVVCARESDFDGAPRNKGIEIATGDIITYLDTDDFFLKDHLQKLAENYPAWCDWVYYNDLVPDNINMDRFVMKKADEISNFRTRDNIPSPGRIGTSSISHKKEIGIKWSTGYGHDWNVVEQLIALSANHTKLQTMGYVVCHIPGQIDV